MKIYSLNVKLNNVLKNDVYREKLTDIYTAEMDKIPSDVELRGFLNKLAEKDPSHEKGWNLFIYWILDYMHSSPGFLSVAVPTLEEFYELVLANKVPKNWKQMIKGTDLTELKNFVEIYSYVERGTKLIEYDNGMYWIDLETGNCPYEAAKMKHCGGVFKATTLISLRDEHQNPHITIGYDEANNVFTQIKGGGNTKPKKEYHKYVVDLIVSGEVEVRGFKSEYDKSTDLMLDDLSPELYKRLEEGNPEYIENVQSAMSDEDLEMEYRHYLQNLNILELLDISLKSWVELCLDDESFVETLIADETNERFYDEIGYNMSVEEIVDFIFKDYKYDVKNLYNNIKVKFHRLSLMPFTDDLTWEKLREVLIENLDIDDAIDLLDALDLRYTVAKKLAKERYTDYTLLEYIEELGYDYENNIGYGGEDWVNNLIEQYLDRDNLIEILVDEMDYEWAREFLA